MKRSFEFDVVVVGSGVGGATFTDYLMRKNPELKVAILESGPKIDRRFFNQREIDMTALYFNRGSVLSENLQIGVAAGNVLGGSSSVYTGVSFRPPENVLQNWRSEYGMEFLTDDFVNTSLDEIESELNVHELPESWDNDNNRLFRQGAEKLGIPVKRLKINIKNCLQQGFCNLGCTSGAKQGALEVQLPKLKTKGVKIFCNTKVIRVTENTVYAEVKDAPEGTRANDLKSGTVTFKAEKIVLAAGALNTPAILLRSTKGLGLKNDSIGRYLTLHPAMNLNGILDRAIKNYSGFPKTLYTDHFSETDGFYLETSFYYPGITAKNNPGIGKAHREIMKDYHKMMSILVLLHDKAERRNRIRIDKKGKPVLDYTLSDSAKTTLIKALHESSRIFFSAGCKYVMTPASRKSPLTPEDSGKLEKLINEQYLDLYKTPLSSAHPQGGARMGKDSETAVCDTNGKVYGTKSVFVADASLFPTSVQINPYETVMLLAKFVAEQM